jgi:hypothetical protein
MKHTPDDLTGRIKDVPFHKRKTLHSLAHATGIPRSTLHRYFKKGLIRRAKSTVKPHLTPAGIQKRYEYAKSFVEPDGRFNDMMNKVHIDEKWYYVMMTNRRCYLLPDEKMIERRCKHKCHIDKVMFGAALARPRQNPVTGEWWDGKVHLHPFVEYKAAQRNSVRRPAGTIETKTINVNKEQSRRWIVEYVVPAIVAQWPDWCPRDIQIQQDNATPHIQDNDDEFEHVVEFYRLPENGGWNITLC